MPSRINPYSGEIVLTELPFGLSFAARTNSDMTPSKTAVVVAQLAGYGDDYFNNHFYMQVIKAAHELLTIDGAPAPADFAAGATLTGATSLKTCAVVAKLTSTTYIVKSRSGAFTDGEIISDGTNSVDCGAGYPTFAAAAAPQSEARKITDYVSATGTFTVDTFSQVVDVSDEILVVHESLVSVGRNDADNVFDSSAVTKNRDGSLLERTEFIIDALAGTQFRTEQSHSGTVEENAFEMFNISLFDLDSGAIASASIDITGITATMEKSTGGADFSSAGITQPTFVKANGRVYCSYQFLAAQWAVGDLYRLTVSGITAVVDTETVYAPTMVWSNAVLETATIDTNVESIKGTVENIHDTDLPAVKTVVDAIQVDLGDPSTRVNLKTIEAMLGNPDAVGKTLYANLGDFFGQANLQSLLAALGIPDVAGKSLYTCLIADRLDNGTYGLAALKTLLSTVAGYLDTEIAAIQAKTDNLPSDPADESLLEAAIAVTNGKVDNLDADLVAAKAVIDAIAAYVDTEIAAIQADIGDPSARASLKSLEAMLGNPDTAGATLYGAHAGTIDAVNRVAGKMQVKAATVDLAQVAGAYDLFTGTTQDVVVEKLSFRLPNVNVADDATITSISIQSNDATPQVLVSSALGVKANLTAEAQISWTGSGLLKAGKKIQLTIAGGAADAATVCDVVAEFRAVTGGGYLA